MRWTAEDDASYEYESLPDWHPSLFVQVFRSGLETSPDQAMILEAFVTPESAGTWGDFSRARALFASALKISMSPLYGVDAPDVAYVRLVETAEHSVTSAADVPATAHVTLVWRPEIAVVPGSGWRIHHIGEPVPFTDVPRTAIGTDPRAS